MMTRILFAAALSITALAPLAQAGWRDTNAVELNGLGSNALTDNALTDNALDSNVITDNAVAAAARWAHLKGFTVTSVVLPDGTVVGW